MGDHADIDHAGLTGVGVPTATFNDHNARHETGGADAIKLDDLAAPDDNTDLNVLTTKHGLAPKLSNVATEYLSGTGVYSIPSGSGIPATIFDAAGDLIQASAADTAARLAAGTLGQVLTAGGAATALAWRSPQLDYVEFTGAVNITATTEATANTIVTANSITGDAAMAILVECYYPYHQIAASTNTRIYLYDDAGGAGAASIGILAVFTPSTALERVPVYVARRLVPTAATHVYSIRGQTDAGTAIANAGAGGAGNSMPGFIRITRAA